MNCPLCTDIKTNFLLNSRKRDFHHCNNCDLIFVPAEFHVLPEREKQEYGTHNNNPEDQGYRDYLNQALQPLLKHIKLGMSGLDFGSGPGPTLHFMLQEQGFETKIYDPFFANLPELLEQQYDFVTSTETVEHFCKPYQSWEQLINLVKPNGYLSVMTQRHDKITDFADWWYKNDVTHVMFYSEKTMRWIAAQFNLKIQHMDERVTLFQAFSDT